MSQPFHGSPEDPMSELPDPKRDHHLGQLLDPHFSGVQPKRPDLFASSLAEIRSLKVSSDGEQVRGPAQIQGPTPPHQRKSTAGLSRARATQLRMQIFAGGAGLLGLAALFAMFLTQLPLIKQQSQVSMAPRSNIVPSPTQAPLPDSRPKEEVSRQNSGDLAGFGAAVTQRTSQSAGSGEGLSLASRVDPPAAPLSSEAPSVPAAAGAAPALEESIPVSAEPIPQRAESAASAVSVDAMADREVLPATNRAVASSQPFMPSVESQQRTGFQAARMQTEQELPTGSTVRGALADGKDRVAADRPVPGARKISESRARVALKATTATSATLTSPSAALRSATTTTLSPTPNRR